MATKDMFKPVGQASMTTHQGDRYSGGATDTTHRYVKGHFFVFFGFPSHIFDEGSDAAQTWVMGSAKSFTPPGDATLNYVEDKGLGGITSQVLTGITTDQSFSLTFKEFWGSPLRKIFDKNGSYIEDHLGGSVIAKNFTADEYKGTVFVVQTKPVARGTNLNNYTEKDILACYMFDGVTQQNKPSSMFDSSIEDSSLVEIPMQYKFDGAPMTDNHSGVVTKALECLKEQQMFKNTMDKYENLRKKIVSTTSGNAVNTL